MDQSNFLEGECEMKLTRICILLVICLCLSGIAYGQETTGVIEGTVVDAQGARVAGATVLVEGNAFSRTVTTDGEGFYRVLQVPAGKYSITTSAPNFTTEKSENVNVTLGRATTADITLNAGQVSANVVVTAADVAAIDTTSNKIQTNITTDIINAVPRGTKVDSVLKLSGATREEPLSRGFQVDGASGAENTFVIDGSEVTNFRTGQLRETNNLPFQFVQEVQVKTSGFDAEFGGATGGVINVVTKSGGNEFHGDFGMQFETDALSARQNLTGKVNNSDPSGTISGPIMKDRLWFLVSAAPQFYHSHRSFLFPTGQSVDYTRNLRNDYEFARLDSSITSKLRLSGTFTYSPQREHGQIPSYTTSAPPSNDFSQLGGRVAANNVTGSGVWTPTSKLVISARFGRNYLNEKDSSYGVPAGPRIRCLNGGSPAGVPATNPCASGFNSTSDITKTSKDISIRNTVEADASYLVDSFAGRHNFKFGYQLNKLSNDVDQGYFGVGEVRLFWGQSDRGIGPGVCPSGPCASFGYGYLQDFGTVGLAKSTNTGLYVQDSWQPKPRLTLNLGLRLENEDVPSFSE